ncbi:hypothetical protein [Rubellicoccus peritrichatus]|uniref:Uncharacterized protein n=1 Tax=Rubellicoccus peritrichatus TaxID=3080537 RepID=A0AAQ3QXD8_9BACT|nr:hypothetical protein [Puniceicoccus sp. CR14]WOO43578.1 hypothetical protein RZN69_10810 [Puniceicoccus sp. CR14]
MRALLPLLMFSFLILTACSKPREKTERITVSLDQESSVSNKEIDEFLNKAPTAIILEQGDNLADGGSALDIEAFNQLLQEGEGEVIAFLDTFDLGSDAEHALLFDSISAYLSQYLPADKLHWVDGLDERTPMTHYLRTRLFEEWNERAPDEVRAFLEQDPDYLFRMDLDKWLEVQLSVSNFQELTTWASQLGANYSNQDMGVQILAAWFDRDPAAAGAYLNELSPGLTRDSYVDYYSKSIARADPMVALDWAESIQDWDKKRSAIETSAHALMIQDEAAYQNWFHRLQDNEPQMAKEVSKLLTDLQKARYFQRQVPIDR